MSGLGYGTPASTPAVAAGYPRVMLREEVRRILRDSDYPKRDIDRAINSVIGTINQLGRFKFHQSKQDITLVDGTKSYSLDSTFIAEESVVYEAETTNEKLLYKAPDIVRPYSSGWFVTPGNLPTYYLLWGAAAWFEPYPDSVADGKTISIFGYFEVPLLRSDTDVPAIPAGYHVPVIAWGAAAEINPTLVVDQKGRQTSIQQIYETNLAGMVRREKWEPLTTHRVMLGERWANAYKMGFRERVR